MPESLDAPKSIDQRKAELLAASEIEINHAAAEASGAYQEADAGMPTWHFGWRQSMAIGYWNPVCDLNQASQLAAHAIKARPAWYLTTLQTDREFRAKAVCDSGIGPKPDPQGLIQIDLTAPIGDTAAGARILTILAILILTAK